MKSRVLLHQFISSDIASRKLYEKIVIMENIVWSWNEWGRLKEVVLGHATGSAVVGSDHPSEQAKIFKVEEKLSKFVGMRPKEKVDAANAEMENFGRILEVKAP